MSGAGLRRNGGDPPPPEPSREQEDSIDLEQWFAEGHSSEAAEGRSWEILEEEQQEEGEAPGERQLTHSVSLDSIPDPTSPKTRWAFRVLEQRAQGQKAEINCRSDIE